MRKNKKKGKEKWEKRKAISQRGYGVDDSEEWSMECGGTIIGLEQQRKNEWLGGE